MLFNSYIFLFLFLPVTLAGYYTFNYKNWFRAANIFLTGMSLWFYGYFNFRYLFIICGSIIVNFIISKYINYCSKNKNLQKVIMVLGIGINVAVIFYFKYYNFFLENINAAFGCSFELKNIALPLGISFFTFQQISYLVDSCVCGGTQDYSFEEYVLYVSFFPQLVAGPIVLHSELIPQFRDKCKRKFIAENFSKGIYVFALGLFKKVIIADTFGSAVSTGFGNIDTLSSMEALIVSLSYTFQLYFDFSGYCDMACGIGNMINIELPQNFNSPYKAESITEFWDRWHMSLTRFLKTYIYIPLGGNRKGTIRTYVNIMAVYLVSGIWHGANWTFILWGLLHGTFSCLHRIFEKIWNKAGKVTRWAVTFMLINILWVIFRADDIASAKLFIKKMFYMSSFTIREEIYNCFNLTEFSFFEAHIPILNYLPSKITGFHLWMFIIGTFLIVLNCKNTKEIKFKPTMTSSFITAIFILWSVISLTGISTFLYFDF